MLTFPSIPHRTMPKQLSDPEMYSEPCQTTKMFCKCSQEYFATVFCKCSQPLKAVNVFL